MTLVLIFYLPVGWDVLLGRSYFYYLCNKDGGFHIYHTVKLGQEHWKPDGYPKFYTNKPEFDSEYFQGQYTIIQGPDREFNNLFNVRRSVIRVLDVINNKVMGEKVRYIYSGGWVWSTGQPFHAKNQVCPQTLHYKRNNYAMSAKQFYWSMSLLSKIFLNTEHKDSDNE